MITMTEQSRYALSFTSGGLLVTEARRVYEIWHRTPDWGAVRADLMTSNRLQLRTDQSRRTIIREVIGRLSTLSDAELELFEHSSPTEIGYLMWVAACRRYTVLGEFAEEVVREFFLLRRPAIQHADFDVFLRGKALWHPEVEDITDSTRMKLRQNTFRMLREAELIDGVGTISNIVLTAKMAAVLSTRSPSELRFFPTVQGSAR